MINEVNYEMEELVPIVGKLVRKYTSCGSTSVSYEKAEQLMGAVLYCLEELEKSGNYSLVSAEGMTAEQAYAAGLGCVKEKVKRALALYHKLLPVFSDYGNVCLNETFSRGLPAFFQNYNIRFAPQDTILTLDYPVLKDISAYTGIDKIYAFILCISLEQRFLHLFPEEYVIHALSKVSRQYPQMIENLCEPVLTSVIGHLLAGKASITFALEEVDYVRVKEVFMQKDTREIHKLLEQRVGKFVEKHYGSSPELLEYLFGAMPGIVLRLKNAAETNTLCRIL